MMGIRGLMTFCHQHASECTDTVNLIEVAENRNGIIILADFYSFENFMMEHFWSSISLISGNRYLQFDGGEYASLDTYLSKFINDLKSLGIEFVFYIDGAKGSSLETVKQKRETWKRRHRQEVQRLHEIVEMCRGTITVESLSPEMRMRPVLLEIQFIASLKNCGCKIYQAPSGEVDCIIAKELQTNNKAYALISNDSDFLVFQGGVMICKEMFDLEGDMCLGKAQILPEKPLRLMCKVLKSEKVAESLQLSDPKQMVELSIVAGNDFSRPFLYGGIYQALGFSKHTTLQDMAQWVRVHGFVEHNPVFLYEMQQSSEFESAVIHSRKFYSLALLEDDHSSCGFIYKLLCEGIEQAVYPPHVMEMHNGFYWRRMLIEDTTRNLSSETAMIDLRSFIYRILLPRHKHRVTEHGRSPNRDYEYVTIYANEDKTIPTINQVKCGEIFRNLRCFDYIMTHFERGVFQKTWFDRYGRKNGFICYILRYFLVCNWGHNLHVSQSEFLALAAVVFGRCDEKWYHRVQIRPSPRCVSIGNWFQNIYRHAYYFLGKLLHLTHEFPLPKEIFSGSVWTAFYACCREEAWQAALRQIGQNMLMHCQHDMDAIIKEKRHMIHYLTEHIFYFDDRY